MIRLIALFLLFSSLQAEIITNEALQNRRTDQERIDQDITRAVINAIVADKELGANASNVNVTTDRGIVTLTGQVDNDRIRQQVIAKAKTASGVVKVRSLIEVRKYTPPPLHNR